MVPIDVQLDHAGYIVRSLDTYAQRWSQMGFTLSPTSPQMGLNASGEYEPWATANRCAVFETGYLELIGLHRPEAFNPWQARLANFEGAHIIAFRTQQADASYAQLSQHSEDFQPPVQRRRDAPFYVEDILGDNAWGTREMGFRNIFSIDAQVPEARYIVIEHQTPDVLWQPVLTQHDNGAIALVSVSFAADDFEHLRRRLALLTQPETGEARHACASGGVVELLSPSEWAQRFSGAEPLPALNAGCIASCTIRVRSLTTLRAVLEERGTEFVEDDERIWVGSNVTGGAPFEFVE